MTIPIVQIAKDKLVINFQFLIRHIAPSGDDSYPKRMNHYLK